MLEDEQELYNGYCSMHISRSLIVDATFCACICGHHLKKWTLQIFATAGNLELVPVECCLAKRFGAYFSSLAIVSLVFTERSS